MERAWYVLFQEGCLPVTQTLIITRTWLWTVDLTVPYLGVEWCVTVIAFETWRDASGSWQEGIRRGNYQTTVTFGQE